MITFKAHPMIAAWIRTLILEKRETTRSFVHLGVALWVLIILAESAIALRLWDGWYTTIAVQFSVVVESIMDCMSTDTAKIVEA